MQSSRQVSTANRERRRRSIGSKSPNSPGSPIFITYGDPEKGSRGPRQHTNIHSSSVFRVDLAQEEMFPLVEYLGSLAFAVGDPLAVAVFLAVGDWQAVEAF